MDNRKNLEEALQKYRDEMQKESKKKEINLKIEVKGEIDSTLDFDENLPNSTNEQSIKSNKKLEKNNLNDNAKHKTNKLEKALDFNLERDDDTISTAKHIRVEAVEIANDDFHKAKIKLEQHLEYENEKKKYDEHIKKVKETKKMDPKQKRTIILGAIVVIFFVVGAINIGLAGFNVAKNFINQTSKKQELADFIFPLVVIDVAEFDKPQNLDNQAIIASAIWKLIIDEQGNSKYDVDQLGNIYVPDVDIDVYVRKLFGNTVKIKHQTVTDSSVQMFYDNENKTYQIQSTPQVLPYRPRVDGISRTDNEYTIQVSYILPEAVWNFDKSIERIDKIMEYKLKKNKTGYEIAGVKIAKNEPIKDKTNKDAANNHNSNKATLEDFSQSEEPAF